MKYLLFILLSLLVACDLHLEGGPDAGAFVFQPIHGCYFAIVAVSIETGDEYEFQFDLVCPGSQYESTTIPQGLYRLDLYRSDGEVVEVEVDLNRFLPPLPVSD